MAKQQSENGTFEPLCRLCMEKVVENHFRFLDDMHQGSNIYIREMLQVCVPEVDSYASASPTICLSCLKSLSEHYNFKNMCIINENKVRNYIVRSNTAPEASIDLNEVKKMCDVEDNLTKRVKCAKCQFVTSDLKLFQQHMQQGHNRDSHSCKHCDFTCLGMSNMLVHELTEHKQPAQAKQSKNVGQKEQHLKTHEKKHQETHLLMCEYCSYSSKDRSNFKKHQFVHTRAMLKCNFCTFKCAPHLMRKHMRSKHKDEKIPGEKMEDNSSEPQSEDETAWVGHQMD